MCAVCLEVGAGSKERKGPVVTEEPVHVPLFWLSFSVWTEPETNRDTDVATGSVSRCSGPWKVLPATGETAAVTAQHRTVASFCKHTLSSQVAPADGRDT